MEEAREPEWILVLSEIQIFEDYQWTGVDMEIALTM